MSFAATLLWSVAFVQVFVGGRIGQHPTLPVALAVSGSFCVAISGMLVTLACFPGLAELLRPVGQLTAIGATLETLAVLGTTLPANDRVLNLFEELGFSNFLLLPSMLALVASGALVFTRWFSNLASRRRFEPLGTVQSLFLLFRRHHRLLGWLGLALAGAHSVYYLFIPGPTVAQWTGIVATALLAALGLLGLVTSYSTVVRLWAHRILAIALAATLALHWQPFLPATAVLLLALSAAGLGHLKLISVLARLADDPAASASRQPLALPSRDSA